MHLKRNDPESVAVVFENAVQGPFWKPNTNSVILFDQDILNNRLQHLKAVFPSGVQHTIAIKSNPLPDLLRSIVEQGYGLEAASYEEVLLAKKAGATAENIVFDSPVKTEWEIEQIAHSLPGMYVNANTLEELELLKPYKQLQLGLRINPLIDSGAPDAYNVSRAGSKFGVPISLREEIIKVFHANPHFSCLHLHVGSGIQNLSSSAEAIAVVVDLAKAIGPQIKTIDMGGGFPVEYGETNQIGMETYVAEIQKACPTLFEDYHVITEFGRFLHAHSSVFVSRVEYVLDYPNFPQKIAMIHGGADLFVREIYQSSAPQHRLNVLDEKGQLKAKNPEVFDIGGPLCFNEDFLARKQTLPSIERGDYLMVADIGANSVALWSRHCSRTPPTILHYNSSDEKLTLKPLAWI